MTTAIHLICRRTPDDMGLTGLTRIEGGVFRSISWELDLRAAKSLEGGWVYFHPVKADPSYFGGEVVRVELSGGITALGKPEVALIVKARKEGRGQKWRGASHGMASIGGIVDADLPHESVEVTGTDGEVAAAFEAVRQIVMQINTRHNDGRIGVMRNRRGVIGAWIELVKKGTGYEFMVAAGYKDKTYEAEMVRLSQHFPADIVAIAQNRLSGDVR